MIPKRIERFQRFQDIGCMACRKFGYQQQPSDVHHLLSGGERRGDEFTIPLCEYHHRGVWNQRFKTLALAKTLLGPSLALEPGQFHEYFGSDEDLLLETNALLAKPEAA